MTAVDVVAMALQLVVPIALIVRVATGRRTAFIALDTAFAALYLAAIWLAGLWLPLPRYLVGVLALVLAVATGYALRRPRVRRERDRTGLARPGRAGAGPDGSADDTVGLPRPGRTAPGRGGWIRLAMVAVAAIVVMQALLGQRPLPGPALDLDLPLGDGIYRVASGGSTKLLNPHLGTLEPDRFRPWRGQSYAVDLVAVGRWGSRVATGTGLEAYAVFGAPVVAPCAGTVVRALDGIPDTHTGAGRPVPLEGNHVILQCGGSWVVLAHLQRGTVRVAEGQEVASGTLLGRVGNSGQSDEPHLHIHAQTPGTGGEPLSGAPIPVTFDGRYLVRNDRVHGSRQAITAVAADRHSGDLAELP